MEHSTRSLIMITIVISMLMRFASSDLNKDREECTDQLISLSTCLPYVGGEAKAPTKDCCKGFGQVIEKSQKCICILVKDKDDPNLGLKFNATLAAHLPTICHLQAPNITKCISLLHLQPNSALAKEFESLGKLEESLNSTTPSQNLKAGGGGGGGGGGGKLDSAKSDGGNKKSWLGVELSLIFVFSSHIIFSFI